VTHRARRPLLVLLPLSALAACGGVVASSGDGGANDAAGDVVTIGPDAGDASSPVGDAGPGPDATPLGTLWFQHDNTTPNDNSFYGVFATNPQQWSGGCTQQTTVGPCQAFTCPMPPPTNGAYLGAGTLTIAGGPLPTGGVTVTQNPQNPPGDYFYTMSQGFSQGDVLSVAASGGQVSAFGPVAVTAPGPITPLAPQASSTIPTNQDLVWSWSGGEPGAEVVVEATSQLGGKASIVTCTFDPSAGTGTMPAAALGLLQPADGLILWVQQRRTPFSVGPYPAEVGAAQLSTAPATFQ
jgi:hypothetical protein